MRRLHGWGGERNDKKKGESRVRVDGGNGWKQLKLWGCGRRMKDEDVRPMKERRWKEAEGKDVLLADRYKRGPRERKERRGMCGPGDETDNVWVARFCCA